MKSEVLEIVAAQYEFLYILEQSILDPDKYTGSEKINK